MTQDGYHVSARLVVHGDDFSPNGAETKTGVLFDQKNAPGDLGVLGKFKNVPLPYGSGHIEIEPSSEDADLLDADLLDTSNAVFQRRGLIAALRECGASAITLQIDVAYETQCNFELSPKLLGALAELGVTVGVSCFQRDPEDSD